MFMLSVESMYGLQIPNVIDFFIINLSLNNVLNIALTLH